MCIRDSILADAIPAHALSYLGSLRTEVANRLDLIPQGQFNLLWITEIPFFDWDEEQGQYIAMHHPFTAPADECIPYLESDQAKVCLLYTSRCV